MIINVKVKLYSRDSKLEKIGEEYVAHLTKIPDKGKANDELISLISKEFKVSRENVIIKTPSSRRKIVEIII